MEREKSNRELVSTSSLYHMPVSNLRTYGSDIQDRLSKSTASIIENVKCLELGKTGECLVELSDKANSITKRLESKSLFKPLLKAKRWIMKYDSVTSQIDKLDKSIIAEQNRLDIILDSIEQNREILRSELINLERVEGELLEYIEYLKDNEEIDEDSIRLQAVISRAKIITTTVAITKQEINKSAIILLENREISNQLAEAKQNLMPMMHIMMMNSLGARANTEAIKLKKALQKTANKIIIENAKEVEKTAEVLLENRVDNLISVDTITEANRILQDTVRKIQSITSQENDTNLALIETLNNSNKQLVMLKTIESGIKA